MSKQNKRKAKEALIAALRLYADDLLVKNTEYSNRFKYYADEIEAELAGDERLLYFYQYSTHYKGLTDEEPSGLDRNTWDSIVEQLRALSIACYVELENCKHYSR